MFCQYSVKKKKMPNMPKLINPATVEPAAKVGLRKKRSGSMGLRAVGLDVQEGGLGDDAHRKEGEDAGRGPAVVVGLDQA